MLAAGVLGDDELLKNSVKLFQSERRGSDRSAVGPVRDVPAQMWQQLHLPQEWPWKNEWENLFTATHAPPQTA